MTDPVRGSAFAAFAKQWQPQIEAALDDLLPPATEPPVRLHEAMRYALFPGGKRLRPLLVLLGCRAVGADPARALVPAAGVECLHTYSLIHDDLPCMDDDELRRGRPTCHRVYGEALALLAGDALLTLAFEGVAQASAEAVRQFAIAVGSRGMVGGQTADLEAEGGAGERTLERVSWIHDRKTGALITISLVIGALAGVAPAPLPAPVAERLRTYGDLLGRAFQIADDCLDLTGSAQELGKNPQADLTNDKLTWPAIAGLAASQAKARELAAAAAEQAPKILAAGASGGPSAGPSGADTVGAGLPVGSDRPLGTESRTGQAPLDDAVRLLQDVAFAAVERRA